MDETKFAVVKLGSKTTRTHYRRDGQSYTRCGRFVSHNAFVYLRTGVKVTCKTCAQMPLGGQYDEPKEA